MDRVRVTENDLLDEVRAALERQGPEDALTTREMCAAMGVGMPKMREIVRALVESGAVEPVKVLRPRMDGTPTTVSAYRYVKK